MRQSRVLIFAVASTCAFLNQISNAQQATQAEDPVSTANQLTLAVQSFPIDKTNPCNSARVASIELPAAWNVTWENDTKKVALFSKSDEFYTQGVQLGYRFSAENTPSWIASPMRNLCQSIIDRSRPENQLLIATPSIYIGQSLFTPGEITVSDLDPLDRPYAAWLHGGMRLEVTQFLGGRVPERGALYHTIELQLGLTGPPAGGEWAQSKFHELIGDKDEPAGWRHQMKTEPAVQGRYRLNARLGHRELLGGAVESDYILSTDLLLGTLQTSGAIGGMVRIGRNLTDPQANLLAPFNLIERRLAEHVIATGAATPTAGVRQFSASKAPAACLNGRWILAIKECSVFVGAMGRLVAHNAFIDGSLFRSGHSVDGESFNYDLLGGFRLRWERFQLDYTHVRRSKEFSPVPMFAENSDGHHSYGAINVRCIADLNANAARLELACPSFIVVLAGLMAAQ